MASSKTSKIFGRRPVDRVALRVTLRGQRVDPPKLAEPCESRTPLPTRPFRGPREHDLTGRRFGRWRVIGASAIQPRDNRGGLGLAWVIRCACGTEKTSRTRKLKKYKADSRCSACRTADHRRADLAEGSRHPLGRAPAHAPGHAPNHDELVALYSPSRKRWSVGCMCGHTFDTEGQRPHMCEACGRRENTTNGPTIVDLT